MSLTFGGPQLDAVLQDNTLERIFHDPLYESLLFRREAMPELFPAKAGQRLVKTRTGLLQVSLRPIPPGQDPTPENYGVEQWSVQPEQYAKTVDTHMPTSRQVLSSKFLEDVKKIGLNAGQTLNRLVRNRLFSAYLAGNTNATLAAPAAAQVIHVASINGFTDHLLEGEILPVSAANPIPVSFTTVGEPDNEVIAAAPDDSDLPLGPGWLTLNTGLTVGLALRDGVQADDAVRIYRVGGGATVDALAGGNVLTLDDFVNAVAILEGYKVPAHRADGVFHAHLEPTGLAQVFADTHFQRLHDSIPDNLEYRQFILARRFLTDYYKNTECPNVENTTGLGPLLSTGNAAFMSPEIGADMINSGGTRVGRVIITGDGVLTEDYIPEGDYISEAGVTGSVRLGNFVVTNNGMSVVTERVRYTLRAPLDRLMQMPAHTWSATADWGVPSDITTGSGARRKRAIVLEYAIG